MVELMGDLDNTASFSPKDISIDRDGIWYYRGAEMFRKDIRDLLYKNLKRDTDGRYLIEYNNDRCYIDVYDTPHVIKSLILKEETGIITFLLQMPDDSIEKLDLSTLRVGYENALYCRIERLGIDARFSRASYYQIAQYIEYDPVSGSYFISIDGHRYDIGRYLT